MLDLRGKDRDETKINTERELEIQKQRDRPNEGGRHGGKEAKVGKERGKGRKREEQAKRKEVKERGNRNQSETQIERD